MLQKEQPNRNIKITRQVIILINVLYKNSQLQIRCNNDEFLQILFL